MSLLKKKGLLLTHGTIYGSMPPSIQAAVQLTGYTNSTERHNYPGFDWDADMPYLNTLPAALLGTLTDNAPVDMVHWAASGVTAYDTLAPWRGCLLMLERI